MNQVLTLPKTLSRADILQFENECKEITGFLSGDDAKEDNEFATYRHSFAEGVYIREMHLKKGALLTGEIQNYEHAIFLMNGTIDLATDEGVMRVSAPFFCVAKAGTKRIGYAVTDVVWINVHPNPTNETDIKTIENKMVSHSFEEYDNFINTQTLVIQ